MKKLAALLLSLTVIVFISLPILAIEPGLVKVSEVDGNPSSWVYSLVFPNASVSISGSTATITTSGTSISGTPEQGDVTYYTGTEWTSLAHGTSGQLLQSGGHGANPSWTGTLSISTLNLPRSDADPGTTAGQIRSDSSSTEASTTNLGVVKWYDGTNVRTLIDTGAAYTLITKYEYMPIRYAEDDDSVTAPAAAAEIGTTSLIARSFAEDADNGVVFFWQVPGDYVSGIKYRVFYAVDTNASADETIAFGLSGCAFASSAAIACTEGTAVNVTHELTTDEDTGELLVTAWSTAVTIDGTPATGKVAKLLLIRDVSEDDTAGHALVVGIEIKYVGKINPFSDY